MRLRRNIRHRQFLSASPRLASQLDVHRSSRCRVRVGAIPFTRGRRGNGGWPSPAVNMQTPQGSDPVACPSVREDTLTTRRQPRTPERMDETALRKIRVDATAHGAMALAGINAARCREAMDGLWTVGGAYPRDRVDASPDSVAIHRGEWQATWLLASTCSLSSAPLRPLSSCSSVPFAHTPNHGTGVVTSRHTTVGAAILGAALAVVFWLWARWVVWRSIRSG